MHQPVTLVNSKDRSRVKASHNDQMASAYAEVGYIWEYDGVRVTPFAGISYDRLRRGAISESGHAFALSAKRAVHHQAAALLGLRLASAPFQRAGGASQLGAYAAYRRGECVDLDVDVSFVGAPD